MNIRFYIKKKKFVKLGEYGLQYFNEIVLTRAINVVKYYTTKMAENNVTNAIIFGTAGIRTATNALFLINKIEKITSYRVKTITANLEAELIYYGVKQCLPRLII